MEELYEGKVDGVALRIGKLTNLVVIAAEVPMTEECNLYIAAAGEGIQRNYYLYASPKFFRELAGLILATVEEV